MRSGSTSITEKRRPVMVAASGCAPPMPPIPPLTIKLPCQIAAEMFFAGRRESFESALNDSL